MPLLANHSSSLAFLANFLILAFLIAPIKCAPHHGNIDQHTISTTTLTEMNKFTPTTRTEDILYDQRQNGTENLRVQLSDLTLVVLPSDELRATEFLTSNGVKPKLSPKLAAKSHNSQGSRTKHILSNLLINMFTRNLHQN